VIDNDIAQHINAIFVPAAYNSGAFIFAIFMLLILYVVMRELFTFRSEE